MGKHVVTINGKHYDSHTGLPIDDATFHSPETATPTQKSIAAQRASIKASIMHNKPQKSQTLRRKTMKKPTRTPSKGSMDFIGGKKPRVVQKSAAISKFAAHPAVATPVHAAKEPSETVTPHPIMEKVTKQHIPSQPAHKPAHNHPSANQLKKQAIETALENSKPAKAHRTKKRFPKLVSIGSATLAVMLLAGYLTYLNMPTISIRVAAAQAGIDATYPTYHPSGYSLSGPIAYDTGEVNLRFAANTGPHNFTITEKKTNWDTTAVLENHVEQNSNGNYIPHKRSGLTIYTYGESQAAWVNGGIFYTIDGDAPLSDDQILRIATSL